MSERRNVEQQRHSDLWLNPNTAIPSEHFSTAYNRRLPEWRLLANRSANSEHWRNRWECQLAMVGVTMGFNNMVFLPSMYFREETYGTFAIQFVILEFLIGFPLLFLQLAVGQFTSFGPFRLTKLVPLAEGVGIALLISNAFMILRESVFMSWTVFYILGSFYITTTPVLDWTTPWSNCSLDEAAILKNVNCSVFPNVSTLINSDLPCYYTYFLKNVLELREECDIINVSTGIGPLNWKLVCCLVLIWILGYGFIYRGITSIGKAVVWVIPIAVVLFAVFVIVGLSKYKGASEGIKYYFSINWKGFYDFKMWYSALNHVLKSLGLVNGTMIVVGAYAKFQSPTHYDAFYVCVIDVFLSFFAGIVIFSFIGITAKSYEVSIDELTMEDQAHFAIFIVFPCALQHALFFPPFWTFMCFGTLLLTTLTSMHTQFLVFLKPLYDYTPIVGKNRPMSSLAIIGVCFIFGVFWLWLTSNGVQYLQFQMQMLSMLGRWIILTCFVAAFAYGYGIKRLREDIDFMLHFRPNRFFCVMWLVMPVIFLAMTVGLLIFFQTDDKTEINSVSKLIYTLSFIINVIPIPAMALWNVFWFWQNKSLSRIIRTPDDSSWDGVISRTSHGMSDTDMDATANLPRRMAPIVEVEEHVHPYMWSRWERLTQSWTSIQS